MTNTFFFRPSPAVESYKTTLTALLRDPKNPYALIQHERSKGALSGSDFEQAIPIAAGAMFGAKEELPRFVAYRDLVEMFSNLLAASPEKALIEAENVALEAAQKQHPKRDNLRILAETLKLELTGKSARRHLTEAIQRIPGPSQTKH